jgi:hypothetical protein
MLSGFKKATRKIPKAKAWFNATPNEHQAVFFIQNETAGSGPRVVPKYPPASRALST